MATLVYAMTCGFLLSSTTLRRQKRRRIFFVFTQLMCKHAWRFTAETKQRVLTPLLAFQCLESQLVCYVDSRLIIYQAFTALMSQ